MRTRRHHFVVAALVALACLIPRVGAAEKIRILGHRGVPEAHLSKQKLRTLLSGQTSWDDGRRVILVLPPKDSPEMKWLCKNVLKMPERLYRRHLLSKVFRGQIARPIEARSSEHAARLVKEHPGSVAPILGFFDASSHKLLYEEK